RRIEKAVVKLPKIAPVGPRRLGRFLAGAEIESARRRGKFIIHELSGDRCQVVHLKMTGQFLFGPVPDGWPEHVHLMLRLDGDGALLYRDIRQFGRFYTLTARELSEWPTLKNLGPEPFELTGAGFAEHLAGRRGRVKPLLLNQSFLAGLGNIYADESLFAAGIHPLQPAERVGRDKALRLHREMVRILSKAISLRGSTTSNYVGLRGVGGRFQEQHQVYGKGGRPCPVCGLVIERIVVGGRGTCFCPSCQPAP
ncbi:MAG: bifunctional DNA-formamidopyrimidine glycosylase/DNA-(apurinic or apyrimidinic site) lyase, partial [Thermodesulfobacteriota bacterium]